MFAGETIAEESDEPREEGLDSQGVEGVAGEGLDEEVMSERVAGADVEVDLPLFRQRRGGQDGDDLVEEVGASGLSLPMFDGQGEQAEEAEGGDAQAEALAEDDEVYAAVALRASGKKGARKRKGCTSPRQAEVKIDLKPRQTEAKLCQRIDRWAVVGAVLISLAMLGVLYKVYRLQVHPPQPILALMDSQNTKRKIVARPGSIYDRNGVVLANSDLGYRLFIDPQLIKDPSNFAERIAQALGYDPSVITEALFDAEERYYNAKAKYPEKKHKRSRFVVIDRQLTDQRLRAFQRLQKDRQRHIPGLGIYPFMKRNYPQGHVAGQILGKRGGGVAREGLERVYRDKISATSGSIKIERDPKGNAIQVRQSDIVSPVDGRAVTLSIDIVIQKIAEENLKIAVDKFKAKAGQCIVMDPHTGEILAMANYPFFDHSIKTKKYDAKRSRNRCVTDVYEPGSTFKPYVWASALQSGQCNMGMMIDCTTSGAWKPPRGSLLHDSHPHGRLSFEQVLVKSSNIGMGKIGYKMGKQKLYNVVTSYGFGQKTASGLLGEVRGKVRKTKHWSMTDLTRVPMGHGVAVTPLQMARAFCVFANGGHLITPTILAIHQKRNEADQALLVQRVLDQQVASKTREAMFKVVTQGTGKRANSQIYKIFGKTGTAQLPIPGGGGYYHDRYVGSFIGGAPLKHPRIVVLTVIQDPKKGLGHYGGTVAGPATKRTIEQTLRYLGVTPRYWKK